MAKFFRTEPTTAAVVADESFVQPIVDDTPAEPEVPFGGSPTLDELLTMKPDATFRKVRIPRVTRAARVQYDRFIKLNNKKFFPGQTYLVHPIIADELEAAIERFEAVPTEQMTGKTNMTPELLEEIRLQAATRTA